MRGSEHVIYLHGMHSRDLIQVFSECSNATLSKAVLLSHSKVIPSLLISVLNLSEHHCKNRQSEDYLNIDSTAYHKKEQMDSINMALKHT